MFKVLVDNLKIFLKILEITFLNSDCEYVAFVFLQLNAQCAVKTSQPPRFHLQHLTCTQ